MNSPATTLSGADSHSLTNPSSSDSMPRNMMGPSTNPPTTFAGTLTSEADPKVSIETGAVERLAAVVTPTCSGSGPGRKPNSARERPRQQQEPGDRRERQLEAHVEEVVRVDREQPGGRRQPQQPAVAGPRRQDREQPDDPGDAGAHDRRRRAGQQHVGGHHRQEQHRAHQPGDAEQRERERPHGAEQHHVLARHGHDVQQAAARKSSIDRLVTPSSSPSTMPWSTSLTGECTPAQQVRPRRQAQAVDRAPAGRRGGR